MAGIRDLLVSRASLRDSRIAESEMPAIGDGEALLSVDAFSITANNVTYAAFGDALRYWSFFPAEEGWGRVPVWGFATVIGSKAEGVSPGKRVYGYLPMSTHLKMQPQRVTASGFMDGVAHRRDLPSVYQNYTWCDTDPLYRPETEALQMLYRPLFTTSFLIDDLLEEHALYGARQVLFSSASAKTAYAAARQLSMRGIDVVGLTSAKKLRFVAQLGVYKRAVSYGDVETLDSHIPTAFVDIAGDAAIRARVHRHFGDRLKLSLTVGATHWDQGVPVDSADAHLPGPKAQMFFAPDRITKRIADWGPDGFAARTGREFANFLPFASSSMIVETGRGLESAARVFDSFVAGGAYPRDGHIINLR
jgi:hypothetical protein